MIRNLNRIAFLAILLLAASCVREGEIVSDGGKIRFNAQLQTSQQVATRTPDDLTLLSTLENNGIYISAVTEDLGSDIEVWSNQIFEFSDGVFSSERSWPDTDPGYRFYACSKEMEFHSEGPIIVTDGINDVVCAYLPDPEFQATNTLEFEHIHARLDTVMVKWEPGYILSEIRIMMYSAATDGLVRKMPVSGTYNLKTGEWSDLNEDFAYRAFVYEEPANTNPYNPDIDSPVIKHVPEMLMIPGEYMLSATWDAEIWASPNDWYGHFDDVRQRITIEAGKSYTITAVLGGDASMLNLVIDAQPLVVIDPENDNDYAHWNIGWEDE
jgi:hypothetical protein